MSSTSNSPNKYLKETSYSPPIRRSANFNKTPSSVSRRDLLHKPSRLMSPQTSTLSPFSGYQESNSQRSIAPSLLKISKPGIHENLYIQSPSKTTISISPIMPNFNTTRERVQSANRRTRFPKTTDKNLSPAKSNKYTTRPYTSASALRPKTGRNNSLRVQTTSAYYMSTDCLSGYSSTRKIKAIPMYFIK